MARGRTLLPLITLPGTFRATHETAGLPGYPAIDIFGPAGARVAVRFGGVVRKVSGRACTEGGAPGGAYGRSVYIFDRRTGDDRFLTHFDKLIVEVGDVVWPGHVLGTLCDSAVSGKPGTTHAHLGMHRGARLT